MAAGVQPKLNPQSVDPVLIGRVGVFFVCILVLLAHFAYGYNASFHPETGFVKENDSLMHLHRALVLAETGDWWNTRLDRVNPPEGHVQHWSRQIELINLVVAAPFRLFTDWRGALTIGTTLWPPLAQIGFILLAFWAFRPLLPGREAHFFLGCALVFLYPLYPYGAVGRVDQHMILLLHYLAMLGFTIRLLLPDATRKQAFLGGIVLGSAFWCSVEILHAAAIMLLLLGINWLFRGQAQTSRLRLFGHGFALAMSLALFIDRGLDGFLDSVIRAEWDRISLIFVFPAICVALFWELAFRIEQKKAAPLPFWGKMGLAGLAGLVCAAGVAALRPSLLNLQIMEEAERAERAYRETRFRYIAENKALTGTRSFLGWGWFMIFLGGWLIGMLGIALVFAKEMWQRRWMHLWPWLALLAFMAIYIYRSPNLPLRVTPYLAIAALPATALVFAWINQGFRRFLGQHLRNFPYLPGVMLVVLLNLFFLYSFTSEAAHLGNAVTSAHLSHSQELDEDEISPVTQDYPLPEALARLRAQNREWEDIPASENRRRNDPCNQYVLIPWLQALFPAEGGRHVIMTTPDVGPAILNYTPHAILSMPNHRPQPGHSHTHAAMHARTDAQAYAIIQESGADVIVLCKDPVVDFLFGGRRPNADIFGNRLRQGQVPDWLIPLGAPDADSAKSFEVFLLRP